MNNSTSLPGSIQNYVNTIQQGIKQENGSLLAQLYSFHQQHNHNNRTYIRKEELLKLNDSHYHQISSRLNSPWSELTINYLKIYRQFILNDYHFVVDDGSNKEEREQRKSNHNTSVNPKIILLAAEDKISLVQQFHQSLNNFTRWILPVVYILNREMRDLAIQADRILIDQGSKPTKLEEAVRTTYKALTSCLTDRFSAIEDSRKWGIYALTNLLFRVYFRLQTTNLCNNVLKAIYASDPPRLSLYPLADRVQFAYYQGILAFTDESYVQADKELSFAFENCHENYTRNKIHILNYLIPVRMLKGQLPSNELLQKYSEFPISRAFLGTSTKKTENNPVSCTLDLKTLYQPFIESIQTGNIGLFDQTLEKYERDLIQLGTYLAVEKSRFIVLRETFRRVWLLNDKNSKLPIDVYSVAYNAAMEFSNSDPVNKIDVQEVECLLANLIDRGLMKGYLSQEKQFVVLSQKDPFPPLQNIMMC